MKLVKSDIFDKTRLSKCPFDTPEGKSIIFNTDFWGRTHSQERILPGPFSNEMDYSKVFTIWKKPAK